MLMLLVYNFLNVTAGRVPVTYLYRIKSTDI